MNDENDTDENVELSFLEGKGNYVKDLLYIEETDKSIKFCRKKDNKSVWIPKSLIKEEWKKEVDVLQNVFIKDSITHLELKWRDE